MRTLKSSIFWKIYTINLVVIFTLLGLIYFKAEITLPEISRDKYKKITDETTERLKDQIQNVISELEEVGLFVQSQDYFEDKDPASLNQQLAEIVTFSSIIDSGTILNRSGEVVGFYPNDLQMLKGANLSDREYFQQVVQTKRMFISDVVSASTNRFVVVTSIPIINAQDQLQYVVNLSMRIEDNPLIRSIIHNIHLGDGYAYIVDQQGKLISHPSKERIGEDVSVNPVVKKLLNGQSGYEKVVNTKNVEMYASYEHVPVLNWGIIAQVPVTFTYVSFEAFLKSLFAFSIVLFIFLSIFTAVYARQIVKPIQRLYRAVDLVASGDYQQRIDEINHKEIGKLSIRFNEMSEYIHQARMKIQTNEKLLTEQKEFLKKIIDANPSFIYAKDSEGKFTLVNQAFAKFYGKKPEDLLAKEEADFNLDKEKVKKSMKEDRKVMETLEGVFCPEEALQDADGNIRWMQKSKIPIIGSNGKVDQVLCVAVDITERIIAEEIIRKSEKLSVVGQLAAGVAHEIRNPLTSIKGFLQLLQPKYEDSHYFEIMLSELDRINLIISEFLILSKPQAIKFENRNVLIICQRIIDLFETQAILNNINILTEFDSDIPLIQCEENQIKQVLVNIIKNSIEAMPKSGGNIKIQVKRESNESVVLRFIDEGCGISKQRLEKLGEPFYSTKEKGTGLGLMVSFKIIENHGGTMKIESEEGKGTTVEISLPINK